MPQKLKPERLEQLALKAVGEWVKLVGRGLVDSVYIATQQDPSRGQLFLQSVLELVRENLFATVPWYLFDRMAEQILICVNELINETKATYDSYKPMTVFMNRMKVAVAMTEVVMHRNLKQINVSSWPKIMRHVINQNLFRLEGLEYLNLGSGSAGWDTSEAEKYILSGVKYMTNLTSFCLCFDCTNTIINVLGNNCLALEKLDITASKSVTDRGLPSLFNCKRLKEVNLYRTSVTILGYRDLLSELPNIQNIGRCDDFGSVLEILDKQESNPLALSALQCKDMSYEELKLLINYCPNLTSISLFHDDRISDLTILKELHNLKDMKLLNCDFFTDLVKQLLEWRGKNLELLHLEHVEEIDLNALIYISQFCPNLKTLSLYNCEFAEHRHIQFDLKNLPVSPFACLEKLVCVSDCSLYHLEFLMQHSKNIKYIQLGSSTGIDDATLSRVLGRNPMKSLEELKILYSSDLSMQSVRLLMTHCDRLRTLSELESWEGISSTELKEFRQYIHSNNIELDTRPTLSY